MARGAGGLARLRLGSPWTLFYVLLVVAGVTNYLPTRYGPAAAWLALGFTLEYAALTREGWSRGTRGLAWSAVPWTLAVAIWTARWRSRRVARAGGGAGGDVALVPRPLGSGLGAPGPGAVQPLGRGDAMADPTGLARRRAGPRRRARGRAGRPRGCRGDLARPPAAVRRPGPDRRGGRSGRLAPLRISGPRPMMDPLDGSDRGRTSGGEEAGSGAQSEARRHRPGRPGDPGGHRGALFPEGVRRLDRAGAAARLPAGPRHEAPAPRPADRPDRLGGGPLPADGHDRALRREPDGREPGAGGPHAPHRDRAAGGAGQQPGHPDRSATSRTCAGSSPSRGRSTRSATPTARW